MLSRAPTQTTRLTAPICRQCARTLTRRQSTDVAQGEPILVHLGEPLKPYRLIASVILNRGPLLTRQPTPFESAYYEYQRRIARALSNPFPAEFYLKKGSVAERRFNTEEREREIAAFGTAVRVKPAESEADKLEEEEEEEPRSRESEADRTGDVKSLDRKGDRNLYLLLRTAKERRWRFPQGDVLAGEALHKAALRDLYDECGPDMQAWIVGRQPIGTYQRPPQQSAADGEKVFFFKGHILAGQARPNPDGDVNDFAWLTKEEVEERVETPYWEALRDVLSQP